MDSFIDTEPPTMECPPDSSHVVTGGNSLRVYWSTPTVIDNSNEYISPVANIGHGHMFSISGTAISYTAVDSSGNNVTCDFQVFVKGMINMFK